MWYEWMNLCDVGCGISWRCAYPCYLRMLRWDMFMARMGNLGLLLDNDWEKGRALFLIVVGWHDEAWT